jgi:hypothetical protein
LLVVPEFSVKVNEARDEGRAVGEEQQPGRQQGEEEEEEDEQVSCCVVKEAILCDGILKVLDLPNHVILHR